MLTMLLGGLWHGANWTFVVWGGIHGAGWRWNGSSAAAASHRISLPPAYYQGAPGCSGSSCFTWFVRRGSSSGRRASARRSTYLRRPATGAWRPEYAIAAKFLAVFTLPLFALDLILELRQEEYVFATTTRPFRLAAATAFATAVTLFAANEASAFIYFQF